MWHEHFKNSLGRKSQRIIQYLSINGEVRKTNNNKAINGTKVLNGIRSLASKKEPGIERIPHDT